jgi:hypothetical protein
MTETCALCGEDAATPQPDRQDSAVWGEYINYLVVHGKVVCTTCSEIIYRLSEYSGDLQPVAWEVYKDLSSHE